MARKAENDWGWLDIIWKARNTYELLEMTGIDWYCQEMSLKNLEMPWRWDDNDDGNDNDDDDDHESNGKAFWQFCLLLVSKRVCQSKSFDHNVVRSTRYGVDGGVFTLYDRMPWLSSAGLCYEVLRSNGEKEWIKKEVRTMQASRICTLPLAEEWAGLSKECNSGGSHLMHYKACNSELAKKCSALDCRNCSSLNVVHWLGLCSVTLRMEFSAFACAYGQFSGLTALVKVQSITKSIWY